MLNSVVFCGIFVDSTNREAQSNGRLATLPKVELRKFNFPILCGNVYSAVFAEVCEACKIGKLLRSSRPTDRLSMAFPSAACHEKRHDSFHLRIKCFTLVMPRIRVFFVIPASVSRAIRISRRRRRFCEECNCKSNLEK